MSFDKYLKSRLLIDVGGDWGCVMIEVGSDFKAFQAIIKMSKFNDFLNRNLISCIGFENKHKSLKHFLLFIFSIFFFFI